MSEFDEWFKSKTAARPSTDHEIIAPLAKRIAEENQLEWQGIKGSGQHGLIVEKDVLMVLAKKTKKA